MGFVFKKPTMRRYHKSVYFPKNLPSMVLDFFNEFDRVCFTHHAEEQLSVDKRGTIPKPTKLDIMNPSNRLVEIYEILDEVNAPSGVLQKIVVRVGFLSDIYDFTYVISREGVIVTAWINDKGDEHRLENSVDQYYAPTEYQEW